MHEDFSEEEKRKKMADELIIRKSLLKGTTGKIAKDNVFLKKNISEVAKDFLRNNKKNSSEN